VPSSTEQVGFVGVGNQGGPIALRIAAAGIPLLVWARRPEAVVDHVAQGASVAATLADLGAACDLVAVCVTTDDDVRAVVLADGGLLPAMRTGSSLAIHSTVHPDLVREIAAAAAPRGVTVLDAPVSGGSAAAGAGTMAVLVGGDPDVLARWQPVLVSYATTVELLGPVGSGQLAKLVNNALAAANVSAAVHARAAAAELGLDPEAAQRVLQASSGDSFMLRSVPVLLEHGPALAAARFSKDVELFRSLTGGASTPAGSALWAAADTAVAHLQGLGRAAG
jgi:3-hydroxyisobutyrate dehydrogenase